MSRGCGIRPSFEPVEVGDGRSPLSSFGIQSGHSLVLKDLRDESSAGPAPEMRQGKGWDFPPIIPPRQGRMVKQAVPGDNSCLYHCVARATDAKGATAVDQAMSIRRIAAVSIARDPERYNTAFLGMQPAAYTARVLDPNQWGGAIELDVLSRALSTEFFTFDYLHLREDRFGEGLGHKRRSYLIYHGNHYDMIQYEGNGRESQVRFSPKDSTAWQRARDFIQSIHSQAARDGRCALRSEWRQGGPRQNIKSKPKPPGYVGGSGRTGATWKCGRCTLDNSVSVSKCAVCGAQRVEVVAAERVAERVGGHLGENGHKVIAEAKKSKFVTCSSKLSLVPVRRSAEHGLDTNTVSQNTESNTNTSRNSTHSIAAQSAVRPAARYAMAGPSSDAKTTPQLAYASASDAKGAAVGSAVGSATASKAPRARVDDSWSCPKCTFINKIKPDTCQLCHAVNPNYRPDPSLFPDSRPYYPPGSPGAMGPNDSSTLQQLIGGGGLAIDPATIQQLQLASIPAWVCPACRVLNARGTIRCALEDCRCINPLVGGVPQRQPQQQPRPQAPGNARADNSCVLS